MENTTEQNWTKVWYRAKNEKRMLVILDRKTAWLTKEQLATMYGIEVSEVTEIIRKIYKRRYISARDTKRRFEDIEDDGNGNSKQTSIIAYNHDMVIYIDSYLKTLTGLHLSKWMLRACIAYFAYDHPEAMYNCRLELITEEFNYQFDKMEAIIKTLMQEREMRVC